MKGLAGMMKHIKAGSNRYEHRLDRRIPFGNGVQFDLWWFRVFVYKQLPEWRK
jgi:hypothetical protein